MNSASLLKMIFEGAAGNVLVISAKGDTEIDLSDIPDDVSGEAAEIDMVLDGLCYGVRIDTPENATFQLVNGAKTLNVVLFEEPVAEDTVPIECMVDIPLVSSSWEYVEGTGVFCTFEEVFGVSGGVTNSDMEVGNAEDLVEDASVGGGMPASAGSDPDAEATGIEEHDGNVHAEQEESSDPACVNADGAGEDGGPTTPSGVPSEPNSGSGNGVQDTSAYVEFNHADLRGIATPAFNDFMSQTATLSLGEVWGMHDRRNTPDDHWAQVEMPWGDWLRGGAGTKNTPAWGFSWHPVGKNKEGACIVLGSSVAKSRKAKAMEYMYAMGLDVDSGATLDDVLVKIEKLGLLCLVYTSYNHGKTGLQLKRDDVLRKLQISHDPSLMDIKRYLTQFDKNRYEGDFIDRVTILHSKKQVKDGVVIELDTPPLEKFRLIFPLETPVKLVDLAGTHEGALTVWEDKITGLARSLLKVNFDTSCTDPGRVFYTARHPKDAEDWYCAIIQGDPLKFEDVPTYKKALYARERGSEGLNAFERAGGVGDTDMPPQVSSPKGLDLNSWHSKYKERFLLADLLEATCPDKLRLTGSEPQGLVTIECPFESFHSSEGGSATMAGNALDTTQGFWTIFCHHSGCQGRHKLEFLNEMLVSHWFDEELLTDRDAGFILPPSDQDDEDEEEVAEEPETASEEPEIPLTWEEQAQRFTKQSTQEEIEKFMKKVWRSGPDMTVRANVIAALVKATNLLKKDLTKIWDGFEKAKKEREAKKNAAEAPDELGVVISELDFEKLCTYGLRRIKDANAVTPTIFHYMENLCLIRENSEGHARMKFLDKDGFSHHLNNVARYLKKVGEDKATIGVSAPDDVVKYLFAGDYGTYPELRGLVSTPTYTRTGARLDVPGYDWDSRLYYNPDQNLVVRSVNDVPTTEEVQEAKRLLIQEVLADFPLGGFSRSQIEELCLGEDAEGIPAVANVIAMILLPFLREMVVGPTPGHAIRKSTPGTGASLLTDVFSIIASGRPTPALALPTNKDEMSKTLTSVLSNGQNIVFFDNVNHSMDSGELASAMTAPTYQARLLGKSQTIEVDVRCVWVFSGNNISASKELLRRFVSCELDANMANPELRTEFRHKDIRGWATEHRGLLVWACLTLIQNFVAKGMPKQNEEVLASYENWSRVVGGVLKEAGIKGFLKNRSELLEAADDDSDDEMMTLLEMWWSAFKTKEIHLKGRDKTVGLIDQILMEEIPLSIRKTRSSDGDETYLPSTVAKYLSKFKDRMFKLEDGTEVSPKKLAKRTKDGHLWQLVSSKAAPKSNVGA